MKNNIKLTIWTLNHLWVIFFSYLLSIFFVLLPIHGAFGFSMDDDGTYLSNALMHIGSGAVLALATGLLQYLSLKRYFKVSFKWVWALLTGFVFAEIFAGVVLWKLEIYRGLINVFNTSNHIPEALIFAFAGLITGILQFRLLKPHFKKHFYWIVSSTLGWGFLILSTYLGLFAFLLGAILYGFVTGLVLFTILELKPQNKNGD